MLFHESAGLYQFVPGDGMDCQYGKKSVLEPNQIFNFVAYQYNLLAGRFSPKQERWEGLQKKVQALVASQDVG